MRTLSVGVNQSLRGLKTVIPPFVQSVADLLRGHSHTREDDLGLRPPNPDKRTVHSQYDSSVRHYCGAVEDYLGWCVSSVTCRYAFA